jgi:hypothetical protein
MITDQDELAAALPEVEFVRIARLDVEIARVASIIAAEKMAFASLQSQHYVKVQQLTNDLKEAQSACANLAEFFKQAYAVDLSEYEYRPDLGRYARKAGVPHGSSEPSVQRPNDGVSQGS